MWIFGKAKNQNKQIEQHKNESERMLRRYAMKSTNNLYEELSSTPKGLSEGQALERLGKYGKNAIVTDNGNTTLHRLCEAVINPFNIALLVIAGISFFTEMLTPGASDYLTIIIILSLVVISGTVAFIQGQRSNAAAEKLSKMISNNADVLRDGNIVEVSMEEIVPGDIVKLSAGDMLPADLRFLTTKDTFVAQSALTGESAPIEKFSDVFESPDCAVTDLPNVGFMGTNIVSGSAMGLVLTTGNDTYFGSMAESLSGDRAKTSFERGVTSVSSLLLRFMFVMVPIVFMVNGITKHDWTNALLFAISVSVGLMPEMLPVIMTSTLAKGAVTMSRLKVIVKTLGAIQTFGEMDILCTDKTGTLTEDKIILEKYMNLRGEDDDRILRHAYLNSYFQTGLKNLIDLAIIRRAEENGLADARTVYTRVDEIPFDFTRRRMSVVIEDKTEKHQLITKGAVDEMIAVCKFAELDGHVVPLDEEMKTQAMCVYEAHNAEGLRVIAVARKNEVPEEGEFSVADEIRTAKIPFLQSRPSGLLLTSTLIVVAVALVISFSHFSTGLAMDTLPVSFVPWLTAILAAYFVAAQVFKRIYVKHSGEWL